MNKTIVSDPLTYDVNNMFFDKPKEQSSKLQNGTTINFFRVNIKTKNPDGKSQGDLILRFDRSLCLKISDAYGEQTLSALMLLWDNQEGPTPRQKKTKEVIDSIVEKCREWLSVPENKKAIKKPALKPESLDKLNPLRLKPNEEGEINESDAPLFAVRLVQFKDRTDKKGNFVPASIATSFYSEDETDANGDQKEIDPKSLINKRFYATIAVKIEDIFIGKDISIQFKLLEAVVKPFESGPKRLLSNLFSSSTDDNDDEEENGIDVSDPIEPSSPTDDKPTLEASDNEEDQQEEPEPEPTPAPTKSKRGGKK
jgi:hypothetical protein